VFVSIPFADEDDARAIEPFAGSPQRRLRALETLSRAGVPAGVSVSPLIPGLNDHQVPAILQQARAAGARFAFHVLLRLPAEVEDVFAQRLRAAFPLRADKVLSLLRGMREGRANDPRFHSRMHGSGPRWQLVVDLFAQQAARLGLRPPPPTTTASPFRRPRAQGLLFGREDRAR
jgi:DNA repair photolyase